MVIVNTNEIFNHLVHYQPRDDGEEQLARSRRLSDIALKRLMLWEYVGNSGRLKGMTTLATF